LIYKFTGKRASLIEAKGKYMEYSFLAAASKSVAGKVAKSKRLSLNVNDLIINNTVCCFSSREFCRDEHLVFNNKQYKLADRIDFDWLKRVVYNHKFSFTYPNLLPISPSFFFEYSLFTTPIVAAKKNSEKPIHDTHYLDNGNRYPHYSLPFLLFSSSKRRKKYHYYQSVRFKFKSFQR
jgi:hypothetical protein